MQADIRYNTIQFNIRPDNHLFHNIYQLILIIVDLNHRYVHTARNYTTQATRQMRLRFRIANGLNVNWFIVSISLCVWRDLISSSVIFSFFSLFVLCVFFLHSFFSSVLFILLCFSEFMNSIHTTQHLFDKEKKIGKFKYKKKMFIISELAQCF